MDDEGELWFWVFLMAAILIACFYAWGWKGILVATIILAFFQGSLLVLSWAVVGGLWILGALLLVAANVV